jgi:hypothetical protein
LKFFTDIPSSVSDLDPQKICHLDPHQDPHEKCRSGSSWGQIFSESQGSFFQVKLNKMDTERKIKYNLLNMWETDSTRCSPHCLLSISVVHPKLFFPDPDPTLTLISDPDPDPDSNPDPACL